MEIRKRTNIVVKTARRLVIRRAVTKDSVFCSQCSEQMFSAQTSADLFSISSRKIYHLIEAGEIHFVETAANEIYVCPISVNKVLETI